MPIVRIPTPLRKLTNNLEEVTVSGATLGVVLDELNATYPGLSERIVDENGVIRRFVNIFVNDEDVRFLQEKETPIQEADVVSIVPAIAGG
ncbi:MAG: MoaD/ThiS family protein [Verrucomicrobia bacterium]|jgi:molybdopterin synthase sulfur carrier subunit|nr:MoaD/ThiS family protein [Verrucomicrobiota bacterium]